ncbi:MAG: 4Fe-4S binding protein [Planctomycetota bacterium]|nr:4Fe-4S binding protein [Planctomycetota bacterium]
MGRVDFKDIRHEQRVLAGKTVPVAVTPRITRGIGGAAKSLLDGLALTFNYLIHPSKVVTQQYPENRATLKFPERYRAMLSLTHDDNGYHLCMACKMCERACPNASIKVISRSGGTLCKNALDRYIWRMDSCVFCNACVQACPFGALAMTHDFENAVYDRRLLVFTLNTYAGPHAAAMLKESDEAVRKQAMEPRDRYGGPVPLNGHPLPNIRPLPVTPVTDKAEEGAP